MKVNSFSVVIPCHNEEGSVEKLFDEINSSLLSLSSSIKWECIWVDDGSTDNTYPLLTRLASSKKGKGHRILRLRSNRGQSTAIMAGIDHSEYEWIITMDGDGQNDPGDFARMLLAVKSEKDVICGYRYERKDSLFKRTLPSRAANFLAKILFKLEVNDLGCTLRLFRKELLYGMRISGEMHRTLTIYLKLNGGQLTEIKVNHRARMSGVSKYGSERIFKFLCDLILVKSFKILQKSPLYFFGGLGFGLFVTSILVVTVLGMNLDSVNGILVGTWITFLIGLFSLISLISVGLISELILKTHFELDRNVQYSVLSKMKKKSSK